jgi:hypothetical protein
MEGIESIGRDNLALFGQIASKFGIDAGRPGARLFAGEKPQPPSDAGSPRHGDAGRSQKFLDPTSNQRYFEVTRWASVSIGSAPKNRPQTLKTIQL